MIKSVEVTNRSRSDGTTNVWDAFRVSFTVDTTGTGAKAGDTFTVKMPDTMRTNITSFPMYAKDGKTVVANCEAPGGYGKTLTCTFGDYITTHPDLTGSGWVQAQVGNQAGLTSFTFTTIGREITVPVPGGKVNPSPGRDLPDTASKTGWAEASASTSLLYWSIRINGSAFSGQNSFDIVDTFSKKNGGYTLDGTKGRAPHLLVWKSASDYKSGGDASARVEVGGAINGGTFAFAPTSNGFSASWPNTDPNAVYELRYYTNINDTSGVNTTKSFENQASVNGKVYTHKSWVSTYGEGELDGPGYGSISVAKEELQGDGAAYVDSAREYEVTAKYALRGEEKSETLKLTAGGEAQAIRSLPAGTKVTLSEITPKDAEFTWGKPVFSSPDSNVEISSDGTSAVVTVGDQSTAKLVVTNTVAAPKPKIDIVKKDEKGNDANTADEAVDLTEDKGATGLKFTVKNDGTESLVDVKVSDQVTAGKAKVDNLTCTFPDGSKGTEWAGAFEPGASFPCTAELSGVTDADPHTDLAKVEGKGKYTGTPVSDEDSYNAKVRSGATPEPTPSTTPDPSPSTTPEPSPSQPTSPAPSSSETPGAVTPPTTTDPAPNTSAPDPAPSAQTTKPSSPGLARTGAAVVGLGIAALIALAGGAGLVIYRRRNNS
ncbi:MAG: Ig-like domain-containing protein [Actinomycetaceae bacterium]|nr:Ig-like domain-containing protein [Actinomycetaceae bacterium]